MGQIHLIRHGLTEPNKTNKYYGRTDVPLANEGVDLISEFSTKGIYPKEHNSIFFTSGLIRTEQTFFLIYGNKVHKQIHELKEYDFGDFEMKTHSQLMDMPEYIAWINDETGNTACPNGESRLAFRKRVKNGFERVLNHNNQEENMDKSSIVVCHGGVISVIMKQCFPNEDKNIFQWQPDPGRGYTVKTDNGIIIDFDLI